MYQEVAQLIKEGSEKHSSRVLDDLGGEIPKQCLDALNAAYGSKLQEVYKLTKQDSVSHRVVDLESSWRREQLETVADLIGDIPRHSIGSQLRTDTEDPVDPGLSIDKLVYDVEKLPKVGIVHQNSDSEEDESAAKTLDEYNKLRNELLLKCQAIRLGESKIGKAETQLQKIRNLLGSIEETGMDASTYFADYAKRLEEDVIEMKRLLEESIKKSDSSIEIKQKLQKLFRSSSI